VCFVKILPDGIDKPIYIINFEYTAWTYLTVADGLLNSTHPCVEICDVTCSEYREWPELENY
jgi:hypothetical protein